MGRGRFFESRVTGGASGRNTGSLKSWRDGPLSEQRSIFEKGAFDFEMVDSPHILRYRRNRNGRYAHWMPSTRHARMSCCRNRSLFRFTGIRHACYVESRHPVRVWTISSPAGCIYMCKNIHSYIYVRTNRKHVTALSYYVYYVHIYISNHATTQRRCRHDD